MATKKKPVLVTDYHRGVCFGYLKNFNEATRTATLKNGRVCFYWAKTGDDKNDGIISLAITGPASGSQISPPIPGLMIVTDVAKIIDCTVEATKAWEGATWR